MRRYATVLWGWLRRPVVQDVGLAVALLAGTLLLSDDEAFGPLPAGLPFEAPPVPWVGWVICVAMVLARRSWPVPALVFATVASVEQMAIAAAPMPANLAVPIILYTIASRRPRKISLWFLGGTLLVATAWSVYVSVDGKVDGLLLGSAADIEPAQVEPGLPTPPVRPPPPNPNAGWLLGPTDWGGVPILGSVLVAGWAIGWSVRSRRAYLDELEARARDLERERDQQAALAAAAERGRITRELHDVVAHGLSVIVMQAQGGAAALANRPDDTLTALNTIVETGRSSLTDMRQVLATVGADESAHPVPGLERLPRLVEQVRAAGTPVELRVEGSSGTVSTGVDVSAYRIVQEALTNTMKHAGPGARARVLLSYGEEELTIEVSDNGTGGPPPSADIGHGLRGMRERTALLGGALQAGPGSAGGFVVHARLPLHQQQEPA